MRFLVLPLLAGAATVGAAPPAQDPAASLDRGALQGSAAAVPGADCRTFHNAVRPGEPARGLRLGELPPGDLVLAVYRTENGCPAPVVVRKGIGAFGELPAAPEADAPAMPPPRIVPRRW